MPQTAHAILVLSLVAALGLGLGRIRVLGVSLGVGGVLFVGLLFGHLGVTIDAHVMEFLREFGLILFVYAIGVQVGPGFVASLRRHGLVLNALAAAIVLGGAAIAWGIGRLGDIPAGVTVGLFSGATTNTPSLAAAQQALLDLGQRGRALVQQPGLGYAVAYPFGVLGVILVIALLRKVLRIDPLQEAIALRQSEALPAPQSLSVLVENRNLAGLAPGAIPGLSEARVVISRLLQDGVQRAVRPELRVQVGDVLHLVGPPDGLEKMRLIIGRQADVDLQNVPSPVLARSLVVTRAAALGRTLAELQLPQRYAVTVTRVFRAGVEFTPTGSLPLQFGDRLLCVGEEQALDVVARQELGNAVELLQQPQLAPVFIGLALGVLLGSVPVALPGVPVPVKLGLAGGPLVVAIVLSRLGHLGRLVWYMPLGANLMMRELGIALFLACVGLRAGDQFVATLTHGDGLSWMAWATAVTLVPVLVVALFARLKLRLPFPTLCGLLSASMTNVPALAYSASLHESDAPHVSYATVYPLVMILRVVTAQLLVMLLA
ncbi:MAG: putative transporter [Myxococcota bacterium]|nr:putative transporter [Myxococcota bacterium]